MFFKLKFKKQYKNKKKNTNFKQKNKIKFVTNT